MAALELYCAHENKSVKSVFILYFLLYIFCNLSCLKLLNPAVISGFEQSHIKMKKHFLSQILSLSCIIVYICNLIFPFKQKWLNEKPNQCGWIERALRKFTFGMHTRLFYMFSSPLWSRRFCGKPVVFQVWWWHMIINCCTCYLVVTLATLSDNSSVAAHESPVCSYCVVRLIRTNLQKQPKATMFMPWLLFYSATCFLTGHRQLWEYIGV